MISYYHQTIGFLCHGHLWAKEGCHLFALGQEGGSPSKQSSGKALKITTFEIFQRKEITGDL